MEKYDYIDITRGLAILGVLLVHCGQHGSSDFPYLIEYYIDKGKYGVQLFFIISALTLFMSMESRNKKGERGVINFFIRRFFRIAPLYYVAIVFYSWLSPEINYNSILANFFFLNDVLPNWTMKPVVPGGWSIGVEMSFYLIVPFLFKRINTFNKAINFFIISLIIELFIRKSLFYFGILEFNQINKVYVQYYFPAQLVIFSLGIILFFLIQKSSLSIKLNKFQVLFIFLILFVVYIELPKHIVYSFFMFSLIYFISKLNKQAWLVPFKEFGKVSYGMYLSHFFVISLMNEFQIMDIIHINSNTTLLLNFILRFSILLVISYIISKVINIAIEKPFQNIGKYLIKLRSNESNFNKFVGK